MAAENRVLAAATRRRAAVALMSQCCALCSVFMVIAMSGRTRVPLQDSSQRDGHFAPGTEPCANRSPRPSHRRQGVVTQTPGQSRSDLPTRRLCQRLHVRPGIHTRRSAGRGRGPRTELPRPTTRAARPGLPVSLVGCPAPGCSTLRAVTEGVHQMDTLATYAHAGARRGNDHRGARRRLAGSR